MNEEYGIPATYIDYEIVEQKGDKVWVRFYISNDRELFKDVIMNAYDLKELE